MRLQWSNDLDIDTLESKGHWVTLDEPLQVVSNNLLRFESVIQICEERPGTVSPSDLSFATKFVAVFLFIKVKSSRPMTYQYLTVDMVEGAKKNGGFIDQKKFKTTANYGFDSLLLTKTSRQLLNGYISNIRPLLKPNCNYVLVNKNGDQHSGIGQLMSKMVFDATGKYIHPTRYRQIVETASHDKLTDNEQGAITEDQKHSSVVARVHYQKRRSARLPRELTSVSENCKATREHSWKRSFVSGFPKARTPLPIKSEGIKIYAKIRKGHQRPSKTILVVDAEGKCFCSPQTRMSVCGRALIAMALANGRPF